MVARGRAMRRIRAAVRDLEEAEFRLESVVFAAHCVFGCRVLVRCIAARPTVVCVCLVCGVCVRARVRVRVRVLSVSCVVVVSCLLLLLVFVSAGSVWLLALFFGRRSACE